MTEEWRPAPGWAGNYEVSSRGRVRSIKTGMRKLVLQANGYYGLGLSRDGARRTVMVHRLVALAFLGDEPGMDVRHLDGNRLNNDLSNLRWGTRSENQWDQVRHGTHPQASKTACKRGHPLSGDNLAITAEGYRRCLACKRIHQARYEQTRRAA